MDYTEKYLKYKKKYFALKEKLRGGGPGDAKHSLTNCVNGKLIVDGNDGTYSLNVNNPREPVKIQIHSGNTSIGIDKEYYDGLTNTQNYNIKLNNNNKYNIFRGETELPDIFTPNQPKQQEQSNQDRNTIINNFIENDECKRFFKVDSMCNNVFSNKLPYVLYDDKTFKDKCTERKQKDIQRIIVELERLLQNQQASSSTLTRRPSQTQNSSYTPPPPPPSSYTSSYTPPSFIPERTQLHWSGRMVEPKPPRGWRL